MNATTLDEIETALSKDGATTAIDTLCQRLSEEKDFASLFYALLMKERVALGVSPIPTGPSSDLPANVHERYEEAIRQAGRHVGGQLLAAGDIPRAWAYFRMIGEPEPIRRAIDEFVPTEETDLQPLMSIALYEGVHPEQGFGWLLSRHGLCNAITTLSSQELPISPEAKQTCIGMLTRALYTELRDRLVVEIERKEGQAPPEATLPITPEAGLIRRLITPRPWLFDDDSYHIDVSHLSSVVQMAANLPAGRELQLARELCEYGARLSGRFHGNGEPPFENLYVAYGKYLAIAASDDVDGNLEYFRVQAESADPETVGTFPAEVLVNLLVKVGRDGEALQVARKYLSRVFDRRLTCPSLAELCQKVGDYTGLAEAAREQGDGVHFLAARLAQRAAR